MENEFLRHSSLLRMAWMSVRTVAANLKLVLVIAVVFGLPVDIIAQWVVEIMITNTDPYNREIFRPLYESAQIFSVSFNVLGYGALAWSIGQVIEGQRPTVKDTLMRLAGSNLIRIAGTLAVVYGLILRPAFVVCALLFVTVIFTNSQLAIASLALLLSVTFLWCATFEYVKYSFGEYPAVFEGIFYRAAADRSRFLVQGRRLWVAGVLFGWGTALMLLAAIPYEILPRLAGWPAPGLTTVMGVAHVVYRSLVSALCLAVFFVFQTLVYFRLRREKHDLTYFDLSATDSIGPAGRLAEAMQ